MDSPMPVIPNNPAEILLALDRELDHEVSLVLYGRAALCLGFDEAPLAFQATQDVDAIIRMSQLPALTDDTGFWDAVDRTNLVLSPKGLYITHLFCEDQVFLRPDWEDHLIPLKRPTTNWLKLFRPHAADLILTKMMRGNDSQDMEDIAFLTRQDDVTAQQMDAAFANVRIPDVPELRDAFQRALPVVREILRARQS
jgi:hypothetical protein